jgi:hypothetical protein
VPIIWLVEELVLFQEGDDKLYFFVYRSITLIKIFIGKSLNLTVKTMGIEGLPSLLHNKRSKRFAGSTKEKFLEFQAQVKVLRWNGE